MPQELPARLYPRFSADLVRTALADTPVVLVNGPRQCGKTTLVRTLCDDSRRYLTLDDDTTLAAALDDPAGFVRGLDVAIIDEVQRAPALLRAIKKTVDEDRRPGRFLLTGSANLLSLPKVAESLAGRMAVVDLLPLAQAEVRGGRPPVFLQAALSGSLPGSPPPPTMGPDLVQTVITGGYPEMLRRPDSRRKQAWARDYVRAIVQRDVRDIASIEKLGHMPRLLRALAHHAGQLLNYSQLGGALGLDGKTADKYLGVFEQLFLVRRVPPWSSNRLKRLVKTPKLHFLDSGLLATLRGTTAARVESDRAALGALLETFVFAELSKQLAWLDLPCEIHHYRDKDQDEVDLVIESENDDVVGIEVKAAATVKGSDLRGLRKLAQASGERFRLGIVLYDGDSLVPFGERLYAAPLSFLWADGK